jgi:hypothetical protein
LLSFIHRHERHRTETQKLNWTGHVSPDTEKRGKRGRRSDGTTSTTNHGRRQQQQKEKKVLKRRPPDEEEGQGEGTGNRSTIAPGNQRVAFQGRITRPRIAIRDRFARNEPIKKHASFCTARPCGMRSSCVSTCMSDSASF